MRNPFPGLRPFREDEEYLFFGRESQVDAMVDKLAATHFLAVVGTSGNGKSSLVNCGLRPALHGGLMARAGTSWRMAQFRPGGDPLRAMAHALAEDGVLFRDYQGEGLTLAEIVDTTLRMSKLGLIDIYEQARLGKDDNLLVVVDQFEELFRYRQLGAGGEANVYGVSEEATAFVNLLLEAEDQTTHPIYVVLTMRSDFLGDCAQFPGLAEAINAGQYLVPRMTRDERRAAIAGPVGVGEAEISPLLLTRLVNDVGDNPDQLSILQHALNRTWARWEHEGGGEGPLDLAHYEDIGSMAHALDQHAEKAYDELGTARQRQICEKVFKALTDKATDSRGVRRPTTLGTLCALADATPSEVTEVIDVFRKPSRSFLMPPAGNTLEAETVIDISHESLMRVWQRLDTWADEEARAAQGYRRLANTAVLHAAGEASLWRDPDLQMALNWREHSEPNEVWARRYHPEFQSAMHFLEASVATREAEEKEKKEQSQRELTRARRIALGAAAFSLLLIVVAGFAWRQMSIAENLATTAELREKAALVKELLPEEPLKALVLAIQATGKSQSALGGEVLPRVESSLLSALQVAEWSNVFKAHEGQVTSLTTTRDGMIVSGSDDGTVRLWDRDGKPIGEQPLSADEDYSMVTSVAISSDANTIVSGKDDGTAWLWDRPSGKMTRLEGHEYTVSSVATTPDGKTFVSGSHDGSVRLWNHEGKPIGKQRWSADEEDSMVTSVAISSDGKTIVSGKIDGTVWLWDREGGKVTPLKGHENWVNSVAITPDGKTIVSGSDDGTVRLWDREGAELIATLKGHEDWVISVAITPDGRTIVSGSHDGSVRLWNHEGKPIGEPRRHEGQVTALAISPDGKTIVSGSSDGNLWLRARENDTMGRPLAEQTALTSVAISPNGKTIVGGSDDGSVRLWTRDGKPIGKQPLSADEDYSMVTSVAISSDGKTIVSGTYDGTAWLWDRAGGKMTRLGGHEDWVNSVAITPDGKTIVSGSDDGTVRLWDRDGKNTGKQSLSADEDYSMVTSVAISSDGNTIVSGTYDGTVWLWDREGGKMTRFEGYEDWVNSVAITPDGKTIVSGSDDGTVRVWNLEDSRIISKRTLRGYGKSVTSVAFSPDGEYIVSGGADTTVRLWDRNGNPMGNPFKPFKGKTDFKGTPDRERGADGTDGSAPADAKPADVTIVAFSADGRDIVTVSLENRRVWLWQVGNPREKWIERACARVRNHEVLVEPDNGIAKEISEEADEKAVQEVVKICVGESGGWMPDQRVDFLVRQGRASAREGNRDDVEKAVAAFREAQKLDADVDLNPDTTAIDQEPEAVARKLAAPAKVWEGYQLAQEGDVEGAIAALKEAKKLDPGIDLDPNTPDIDQEPEAVARKLAAPAKVWEGYQLAQEGDVEGAIAALKEAKKLDPGIDLDPNTPDIDQDPKAVARKLAAPAKVWGGYQLAQEGDVEGAIATLREAQKLDPGIDLDPNTPDIDQDPKAVAENFAAAAKVWEGYELAQEGDVEGAIAALKEAKKLDPGIDLDPDTEDIDQDPKAVAKNFAAAAMVWEGYELAQEGDVEGTIAALREAQKLDPGIDLDPDTEDIEKNPEAVAKNFAAAAMVWEGYELAQEGDVEGAIAAFREAQKFDPGIDLDPTTDDIDQDPEAVAKSLVAPAMVWEGYELAAGGNVDEAIAAFREAQKLDPGIDLDPDTPAIDRDSEAVAKNFAAAARVWEGYQLAQVGDIEGAIAAFREAQKLDPGIDLDPDTPAIDRDSEAVAKNFAAAARVWEGYQLAQVGDIEGAIAAFREAQKLDPDVDLDPDTPAIDRDPEAVAQQLAAKAKVWEGYQLAEEGDVKRAIAAFSEAQKLDPDVDLDPDTEDIEQNPEAVAQHLATRATAQEE